MREKNPNTTICTDKYCFIFVENNKEEISGKVIVDKDFYENELHDKRIFLDCNGYAGFHQGRKKFFVLHKMLMPSRRGFVTDHINRRRYDNRRENLRYADRTLNAINKGMMTNNTSGCSGVSWNKGRNKWHAYLQVHGKAYFLGFHSNIQDAIKARSEAEMKYFNPINCK